MKSRYGNRFAIGDYDSSIRLYNENDVLPDDRYLFDRICTIESVRKLFSEKPTHSFSYRVCRNETIQYFECQLVKPDSKRSEFAIGFKNIGQHRTKTIYWILYGVALISVSLMIAVFECGRI